MVVSNVVNKIGNSIKRGLSSNELKVIALIAMIIDHVGYYFCFMLDTKVMFILRHIGRIAMPIYIFSIVEGFFHTKNFKKYITRIGVTAVILQIFITICYFINKTYYAGYEIEIYKKGNVLFSYFVALIVLKILHEDVIVKKWDVNKNFGLKIVLSFAILIVSAILPNDYSLVVPTIAIIMYYLKKLQIDIMLDRENPTKTFSKLSKLVIKDKYIEYGYIFLLAIFMSLILRSFNLTYYTLLSLIPIALYNGRLSNKEGMEKGENKFKYIFYAIFIAQHVILYVLAMIVYKNMFT